MVLLEKMDSRRQAQWDIYRAMRIPELKEWIENKVEIEREKRSDKGQMFFLTPEEVVSGIAVQKLLVRGRNRVLKHAWQYHVTTLEGEPYGVDDESRIRYDDGKLVIAGPFLRVTDALCTEDESARITRHLASTVPARVIYDGKGLFGLAADYSPRWDFGGMMQLFEESYDFLRDMHSEDMMFEDAMRNTETSMTRTLESEIYKLSRQILIDRNQPVR